MVQKTAKWDEVYVGSAACKTCHASIYDRWQRTPMANVVRDPREHPDAILPDLTKPDPLLTFKKDDIWSTAVSDTAQTPAWASDAPRHWSGRSPWRVE